MSLLSSEIEELRSENSRSGWSLWAILASIVGALWLWTEQLRETPFDPTNVGKIFIAGVLLADASYWLYKRLRLIPEEQGESRFYWGHSVLSARRLRLVVDLIRSILLIVLAYHLPLSWFFLITFTIAYVMRALVSLAGLLIPHIAPRFAVVSGPPDTTAGRIGFNGVWLLMAAPLSVALFLIVQVCPVPTRESISDYRVGGLLVVVAVLLDLLISVLAPSSRLQSLTNIRRKLVFNRVGLDDAIIQTEIALGGMRAIDALRDSFTSITFLIDKMDEQVANAELELKAIEDVISNLKSNELTQEQFNTLSLIQRGFTHCLEERGKYYRRVEEQVSDFDDRVKWILRGLPTEHQTINQIHQLREIRMESSDKRYSDLLGKQERIQEQLVRLRLPDSGPKAVSE